MVSLLRNRCFQFLFEFSHLMSTCNIHVHVLPGSYGSHVTTMYLRMYRYPLGTVKKYFIPGYTTEWKSYLVEHHVEHGLLSLFHVGQSTSSELHLFLYHGVVGSYVQQRLVVVNRQLKVAHFHVSLHSPSHTAISAHRNTLKDGIKIPTHRGSSRPEILIRGRKHNQEKRTGCGQSSGKANGKFWGFQPHLSPEPLVGFP